MNMEHKYTQKKWKNLIFCFLVFCSMLSYELAKLEPNMLVKMPGRKHLGCGRLKEMAFQKRFC